MKFTKVIAEALANKARKSLLEARRTAVKEFVFPEEKEAELAQMVDTYLRTKEAYNKACDALHKIEATPTCSSKSFEDVFKNVKTKLAEKLVPAVPSQFDLVDDFLVESIGANDANELIEKVLAKYQ